MTTSGDIRLRTETTSLVDLVDRVLRGEVRIPGFQRGFRWAAKDITDLLDSVNEGYPIGTLLFWRRDAPADRFHIGPLEIDAAEQPSADWVVDGQQRLTSLAGVLRLDDASEDHPFRVFYGLRDRKFHRQGARPAPSHWLPMNVLLDTARLLSWLSGYDDREANPEHLDRATQLSKRFREYRIPVYTVEGTDEKQVREIFRRVNHTGKRLREHEVFDALHGSRGQEPDGSIEALRDRLAAVTGFGPLDQSTLLRSVLATRGDDPYRNFDNEFSSLDDAVSGMRAVEAPLRATVQFLQEDCGFPVARTVPYAFAVPAIARFFAMHPQPTVRSLELLRRWVWRGALAGVSTAGFTSALRQAVKAIGADEHESIQRLLALVPQHPWREPDFGVPRMGDASGRLAYATLWSLGPRHLVTGEPVDPGSVDALLPISGRRHASALADRLLHAELEAGEISEAVIDALPEVLATHAVPEPARVALRSGDFATFHELREAELRAVFERVWTEKAAPRESDRPPIAALVQR